MKQEIPYKIYLEEQEMPKQWYNVRADMTKKPGKPWRSTGRSGEDGYSNIFKRG